MSIKDGLSRQEILAVADGFRERNADVRVIVYVFDEASADRHLGFGLIPSADAQPVPMPLDPTGWIGTIDFGRHGAVKQMWADSSQGAKVSTTAPR